MLHLERQLCGFLSCEYAFETRGGQLTGFGSAIFFGGLSIHISKAILAHMFSYDIQWGATVKEVKKSNFFKEVPILLKRYAYIPFNKHHADCFLASECLLSSALQH